MAKKGIVTKARVMTACVCSVCGQRSNAQAHTVHYPDRKGKWEPVVVEQTAAA